MRDGSPIVTATGRETESRADENANVAPIKRIINCFPYFLTRRRYGDRVTETATDGCEYLVCTTS